MSTTSSGSLYDCEEQRLLDVLISAEYLWTVIVILAVIFIVFASLLIVVAIQHAKIRKLQQSIDDYCDEFRRQTNADMKTVHYPSMTSMKGATTAGHSRPMKETPRGPQTSAQICNVQRETADKFMHKTPHTKNDFNRYSLTTNDVNSDISFDILAKKKNLQSSDSIVRCAALSDDDDDEPSHSDIADERPLKPTPSKHIHIGHSVNEWKYSPSPQKYAAFVRTTSDQENEQLVRHGGDEAANALKSVQRQRVYL